MGTQTQQVFDIAAYVGQVAVDARAASREIARSTTAQRNQALLATADKIESSQEKIQQANRTDLDLGRKSGLSGAMLDRLELTDSRIELMAQGLREIAELPDPIGEISELVQRPSGIRVGRMRVPLGVIGIIYESRLV